MIGMRLFSSPVWSFHVRQLFTHLHSIFAANVFFSVLHVTTALNSREAKKDARQCEGFIENANRYTDNTTRTINKLYMLGRVEYTE